MGQKGKPAQQASKSKETRTTLERIADIMEDGLLVVSKEYRVRFANLAMRQKWSGDAQVLRGKRCYEVIEGRDSPCQPPLWNCPLISVLRSGNPITIVHHGYPPGSETVSERYIKITMHPLTDSQGGINAIVELRRDVTAERNLENHILRRHHHLQALSRISSAASGLWDLDTILKVSLDAVLEILNGAIGGILFLDEETQRLRYRVYRGLSARYVAGMQMRLGEGIAGMVASSGEPILLEDISQDPRAVHPDLVSTEGLKGFASIPLKAIEHFCTMP